VRRIAFGFVGLVVLCCAGRARAENLTLREAIELGYKNHPSIAGAIAQVESAHARVGRVYAALLPQLSLTAQGRYDRSNENAAVNTTMKLIYPYANLYNYSASGSLSQLLYDFGHTAGAVDSARKTEKQTQFDRETTKQNVAINVVDAYIEALRNDGFAHVNEDAVRQYTQQLARARALYKAGIKQEIDVLSAETQLAQRRIDLLRVQAQAETARVQLRQAMGIDGPYELNLVDVNIGPVDGEDAATSLVDEATRNRTELASGRFAIEAAQQNVRSTRGDYFPNISANATAVATETWNIPGVFIADIFTTITVTEPVFSGWATRRALQDLRAQVRVAQASLSVSRQQVAADVASGGVSLVQAKASVQIANEAMKWAERQLVLAEARYQIGVGTFVELNDARNGLVTARTNEIDARYNLFRARAGLVRSLARDVEAICQ
jgi:outer membrane protein TolC